MSAELVESQNFHCHREDTNQLKVFIPLEEVFHDSGAVTALSAKDKNDFFTHQKNYLGIIG